MPPVGYADREPAWLALAAPMKSAAPAAPANAAVPRHLNRQGASCRNLRCGSAEPGASVDDLSLGHRDVCISRRVPAGCLLIVLVVAHHSHCNVSAAGTLVGDRQVARGADLHDVAVGRVLSGLIRDGADPRVVRVSAVVVDTAVDLRVHHVDHRVHVRGAPVGHIPDPPHWKGRARTCGQRGNCDAPDPGPRIEHLDRSYGEVLARSRQQRWPGRGQRHARSHADSTRRPGEQARDDSEPADPEPGRPTPPTPAAAAAAKDRQNMKSRSCQRRLPSACPDRGFRHASETVLDQVIKCQ